MTDYAMKYDKKTMTEYILHTMTGGTKGNTVLIIICAALMTAIPVAALITYFTANIPMLLWITIAAVVMDLIVLGLLLFMIKTYSEKMLAAYAAFDGLVCSVSSEKIIMVHDGRPQKFTDWSNVTDMYDGKRAFYLKTDNDLLIILQKDNVLSGTVRETSEIIAEKQGRSK